MRALDLQTKVREDFTIMEKASTRAFSWLKAATYHGLMPVLHSVLNVNALVDTFNQEKAPVGVAHLGLKV